ncbi:MAG: acetate--CoA ligase [Gammaproteobacteria bacterium]
MPDVYPVPSSIAKQTHLTIEQYKHQYQESLKDPQTFWAQQATNYIDWFTPWKTVLTGDFKNLNIRWFDGAQLNMAHNCLDRHLKERADQPAIIWESDDPTKSEIITYQVLHQRVSRFANALKKIGAKKGSHICIYLPMIPEAAIAMLACARIGAIHSVVFAGFSAEALKTRIIDAECDVLITANESIRGGKSTPLKKQADTAIEGTGIKYVVVVQHSNNNVEMRNGRDHWYHELIESVTDDCPVEPMDANDPLFILYTSGSTGKPKGILHGTGGYAVFAAMTHKLIFDYQEKEIYWCTADIGWVTGHTYMVYGPLLNGATTLMFEGVPNFPTAARFWEIIDKHQVNIFYTAPTALRALRREGDSLVKKTSRKSLRILGTVGEPINAAAWEWYYQVIGDNRCPIVDTWWQTETGGILISPLPGATPLKPGSAAWPFLGIEADIVDDQGKPVADGVMGKLIIKQPWPGMMQTVYKNHERFVEAYFKDIPGCYLTGDQATRDADGYYEIIGRSDDVIKMSGHRIGTQEVENALMHHISIAEAAVVAVADEIKGQNIYAFISLKVGVVTSEELKKELSNTVREYVSAIAVPGYIQFAKDLPKTRSGKIMRRILRKIANNEIEDLGDLTTLADPGVVDILLAERQIK